MERRSAPALGPVEEKFSDPPAPGFPLVVFRPPFFFSKGPVASFEGPLQFFSCPVRSPEGLRCPGGSYIHAPFCRCHLRSTLALDVAPSTIKEAGHGLFTLTARAKGDHLVDYFGESLSAAEVEARYPRKDVGVYCLRISQSLFIDAALSRGVGASANASRHGVKPNARFVVNPRTGSARLEASRQIQAGGEIFVSYGSEYWRGALSTSHSTSHVPGWEWDFSDPFVQLSVVRPLPGPAPAASCFGSLGDVVSANGHGMACNPSLNLGPLQPVCGLSFSLPLLCCSRLVAQFLGDLLKLTSLTLLPHVDVVPVVLPAAPFLPVAGRRRLSVSFWQCKLADEVAPRPLWPSAVRPLGVLSPISSSARRADVFFSVRPRGVSSPVLATSNSVHFDVPTSPCSPCSSSRSFFSSPVPGVVSSSLSPMDPVSPRAASSVSVVPAFPLVRSPSSPPEPPSPRSTRQSVCQLGTCGAECLRCWPVVPVRVAVPEVPPSSPSTCEVNVAPPPTRCMSCVPGLFVCPTHLIACGAEGAICCNDCLQVLCMQHMYCPCADAVARRARVSSLPLRPLPSLPVRGASPAVSALLSGALPGPGVGSPVLAARVALVSSSPESEDSDPEWPISDALRDFAFQTVVFRARSPDLSNNLNNSLFDCP